MEPRRNENESIRDFLLRGIEHLMTTLPEESPDEWSGARPSQVAKESVIALIEKIAWDGLAAPFLFGSLDKGFSIEWKGSAHDLDIEVNADGSLEYLMIINDDPVEEGTFALNDGKLTSLIIWLTDSSHLNPGSA